MKAIFVGSLAMGFGLLSYLDDTQAEAAVRSHLKEGNLAEAVDVLDPDTDKPTSADAEGKFFIVYGCVTDGITVYGPFKTESVAEAFGEKNEEDDDRWSLATLS